MDASGLENVRIEGFPPQLTQDGVNEVLDHCAALGASDITIQTNQRIIAEIHGRLVQVTERRLRQEEVEAVAAHTYGPQAVSQIYQGKDLDYAFQTKVTRTEENRFRVNATGVFCGRANQSNGVQMTFRALPTDPPRLSEFDVEQAILDNCRPADGIVGVLGPTGSGKSTLIAAMLRTRAEGAPFGEKILTYESPIEYVFEGVDLGSSVVAQSEIPKHLPSMSAGVRNAMRRKPNVIFVGESRDRETMEAAADASLTGHAVYTTVHANTVAAGVKRMMALFGEGQGYARAVDLLESLRLLVVQRLLPTVDGKRCAVREYLVFDHQVRSAFLESAPETWAALARQFVEDQGQLMADAVKRELDGGRITPEVFEFYKAADRQEKRDVA